MGMALFFALSGFLIVRFLADGMPVSTFAVRRLARIVPLAWVGMFALWAWHGTNAELIANLLFISNLPPAKLMHGGEHLWSLCVEVQFYAAVALLCLSPARRGLYLLPILCVAITGLRVGADQPVSIVTWHRVDEILCGGLVALAHCGWFGEQGRAFFTRIPLPLAMCVLFVCSHPSAGPLLYLRPYAGGLVLGSTIYGLDRLSERVLVNRAATYIAQVSYALYVIHGILGATWLGSGDIIHKYLKRPLLFAATFALAHLSTFYLEKPITDLARRFRPRLHAPPLVSGRS
jgi:peptidoglycan/LPS O-acetylase OafA/YrhL